MTQTKLVQVPFLLEYYYSIIHQKLEEKNSKIQSLDPQRNSQQQHNQTSIPNSNHVDQQQEQKEEQESHLFSQKRQRSEYATTAMGQTQNQTTPQPVAIPVSRNPGTRGGSTSIAGEIVEVQGGHIVRSTGRKDRHSKVCTAKGPRDRRVRLSAHTAIQFYDVQDRLGYDRPSKAVDWLIKKAKASIDELAELPAWKPTSTKVQASGSNIQSAAMVDTEVDNFGHQNQIGHHGNANSSSFLPASLDSDAIADTIKSFFPMGGPAETSSSVQFQSYPPDLLSRTSSQHQDLRLSLQSFQDPMLLHHHQHQHQQQHQEQQEEQIFGGFDGYQRMVSYGGGDSGGCFVFNTESQGQLQLQLQQQQEQQLFGGGQSQFFSQRGPLQSSNTSSVRAWMEPGYLSSSGLNQQQMLPGLNHQGFSFGGYPGFHFPARIQGEEEHDGMANNKPSSASSDSRH